jgi:sugar phosphate isomerase/epimerase
MYVGISMTCIDHRNATRQEARARALELSKHFNLKSIEVVLEGVGRNFAPYPWEFEENELKELEDFMLNFPHKGVHLPFYHMDVIAVNPRMREEAMAQMKMAIEIAKRIKADYAVVHATGTTHGLATASEPRRQFKAFSRMAEYCEGSGVTLSIENAGNLHDIEKCVGMIKSLRDEGLDISMTLDTGHANLPGFEGEPQFGRYGSVAGALERCAEYINNVHLHNNHGNTDQHLGLLDGTIDLRSCIEKLKEIKYQGALSFEAEGLVDVEKEVAMLKEWCNG